MPRIINHRISFTLLALACVVAASVIFKERRAHQPSPTAGPASSSPVTFRDEDARAYLKQEGTYDSLADAVTAAQYAVTSSPRATKSNDGAFTATNRAQHILADFDGDGARVRSSEAGEWQINLKVRGVGYGKRFVRVAAGELKAKGDRVEINHHAVGSPRSAPLVEWYVNKQDGLEQGFTIPAPLPAADFEQPTHEHGGLSVALTLTGDLRGEASGDGQGLRLKDRRGRRVSNYDHLKAWDAAGRELAARMRVRGREVRLEVDDAGASYPVTVDPLLWQQQAQLTASSGLGFEYFGWSVAVSGNTAIVGAREDYAKAPRQGGSAYIFVRSHGGWTQQQKLTGGQSTWPHRFGESVAIDGDTAVVGAIGEVVNGAAQGSAHVFVRSGGLWFEQQNLFAADGMSDDNFGKSVAISGDTIIVGTFFGRGAYIFTRSNGAWSQQGGKLTNSNPDTRFGDLFGFRVAISGDTAIVGAPGDLRDASGNAKGSASIYVRSGGVWSLQQKLEGSVAGDRFGVSVGISGETAIVGINNVNGASDPANLHRQFVNVFVRSNGSWSPQQSLAADGDLGSTPGDNFASCVAISGDTVVVGALGKKTNPSGGLEGAAYIFVRIAGAWFQERRLTASDSAPADQFGNSVAVSGDTVVVGAYSHKVGTSVNQGAAYVFLRSPDTDGDGLPDDWEKNGVTIDGVFIDLPKMGADPLHKDIFVHADWMLPSPEGTVFKPSPRALKMVSDAFAQAPVVNPDGKPGVNLHVDLGAESIMNPRTGAKWGDLSEAGDVPYQAVLGSLDANDQYQWSGVDAVKQLRFIPAKRGAVFHYALFANDYAGSDGSSGLSRDVKAADFIVTLGLWETPGGTVFEQAGTFMHELGHNLGLHHGGGDEINNKPNYLSVMNYSFQTIGLLKSNGLQRSFDYSRLKLTDLNETNLDENVGINDPAGHLTIFSKRTRSNDPAGANKCAINPLYYRLFFPSRALDWDCDGVRTVGTYPSPNPKPDINGDGVCVTAGPNGRLDTVPSSGDELRLRQIVSGNNRKCETVATGDDKQVQPVGFVEPDVLTGFNDWPALDFDGGGNIGNAGAGGDSDRQSTPHDEATLEQILDFVPQPLRDEEHVAPQDVVTLSRQEGGAPLPVTFDGSASTAVGGTITNWSWDFGDGTTGAGATVAHTYQSPGDYYASLTVTDSNGRVNLVPLLNLVTVTNDPPPTPTPTPTPQPTPTPPPTPTPFATPTPVPQVGDTDPSFNATATRYGGHAINAIVAQPDGKSIVGGEFESFAGCARRDLARINADGSCDQSFDPGLLLTDVFDVSQQDSTKSRRNLIVQALVLQPDGKILVGVRGERGLKDGVSRASEGIIRLNPDGSRDTTFEAAGDFVDAYLADDGITTVRPSVQVQAMALLPDGRIVIGGSFTYTNNGTRADIARLNADGSLDASFTGGLGYLRRTHDFNHDDYHAFALQPDGKIIIVGNFLSDTSGQPATPILRINADGSFDPTYAPLDPATGLRVTGFGPFSGITEIALQTDGKSIVGGALKSPDGSSSVPYARLNSDGSRDAYATNAISFGSGMNGGFALQPDGKLIVVGDFEVGGNPATSADVMRLNTDGTLDTSYNVGTGTLDPTRQGGGGAVSAVALQANGKAVFGGVFSHFNDLPAESIVQLNPDGSRDQAFDSNGAGFNDEVLALVRQPDGKLLVGFLVTSTASDDRSGDPPRSKLNSTRIGGIGRLNPDGTTDTTFKTPFDVGSTAQYVALQPDGKIIVGGSFLLIGQTDGNTFHLARLNADGTLDTTFHPPVSVIGAPAIQADGKIILSEALDSRSTQLVRLNPDGSRDSSFSVFISNGLAAVNAFLADGRMLITGSFHLSDGTPARIARLNADGSFDTTFAPGTGPDNTVRAFVMQPDGKILIGGDFFNYNGTPRNCVARLSADGTLDTSFVPANPNTQHFPQDAQSIPQPVGALALQPDGKIFVGSYYKSNAAFSLPNRIFRLNADGTLDSTFPLGTGVEGQRRNVDAILLQPDGQIIIGGEFNVVNSRAQLALARIIGAVVTAPTPTPTPTPMPTPTPIPSPSPMPMPTPFGLEFSQPTYVVGEGAGDAAITVTRTGDTSGTASVDFVTVDDQSGVSCDDTVNNNSAAYARCDYASTAVTLIFAPGETAKTVNVPITDDTYVESAETLGVSLLNPNGAPLGALSDATVVILDNDLPVAPNPVLSAEFFVRQHYLDFLTREPDASGLQFWTQNVSSCGSDAQCVQVRRISTSAAFFLSIEFKETGYFVIRAHKAAFGNAEGTPRYATFLKDQHEVNEGVIVGQGPWQQQIETNKQNYLADFVSRPEFVSQFPQGTAAAAYVDKLFANAGVTPTADERGAANTAYGSGDAAGRAAALRSVVESGSVFNAEYNAAFVLMQYFGYLRRNPDAAPDNNFSGYEFWLRKLDSLSLPGEDMRDDAQAQARATRAEMIRAFIESIEYRQRFGQP